jgi:hypothetical protein
MSEQQNYEERDWYSLVPDDASDLVPVVLTRSEIRTLKAVVDHSINTLNLTLYNHPEMAGDENVVAVASTHVEAAQIIAGLGKGGN